MDRRTRAGLILAALLLLAGVRLITSTQKPRPRRETFIFQTMGTVAGFMWDDTAPDAALKLNERASGAFELVVRTANLRDPESEISRLNAAAGERAFACSPLMWTMLTESRFAWEFSGGAFDITVKPLMDLWGFYRKRGKAPSEQEIAEAKKRVGFDKLIFDDGNRTVRFREKGMALDLGGIAKGFALDLAAEAVREGKGVLDLGGNLKFLPALPGGKKHFYSVGIKDPAAPERLYKYIKAEPGMSVSTSGNYERNVTYGGKTYGHIMDPEKGFPPQARHSVTVVCPSAMRADWLSTAVFLRGRKLAEKVEKEIPRSRVVIIEK